MEGNVNKALALLEGVRVPTGWTAGPASACPVFGCFRAGSGPWVVERNLGWSELLSKKGPQNPHFLQRRASRARRT